MLSIISKNLQNSSQAPNIVLVYGEPGLKKLKVLYGWLQIIKVMQFMLVRNNQCPQDG